MKSLIADQKIVKEMTVVTQRRTNVPSSAYYQYNSKRNQKLAEKVEASVFGPFTRGEAQPDSDLDLLVRYKENVSLFDVSGLKCELEKLLGSKVDLISKDYLKPRIKNRILQESVRIL